MKQLCFGPQEAFRYALLLLKFRPRSEYELCQRLERKGFSESVVKEAIVLLRQKRLVDDFQFARFWVECRIRKALGVSRIKQELKVRGVSSSLIEQAIKNFADKYSEKEAVEGLAFSRWEKLKHIEHGKAKRRLFSYLLRRGFSSDIVQEAVENQFKKKRNTVYLY